MAWFSVQNGILRFTGGHTRYFGWLPVRVE